jgi:hypothetical protein
MASLRVVAALCKEERALKNALHFIEELKNDYNTTVKKVHSGELKIPRSVNLRKLIPQLEREAFDVHEWLCDHALTDANPPRVELFNDPVSDSYDTLLAHLKWKAVALNNQINCLFQEQCAFGHKLELLFQATKAEGKVWLETLDQIGISDTYARKFRWLGNLSNRYQRLYELTISFDELYKRKKAIDNFFTSSPHAADWK